MKRLLYLFSILLFLGIFAVHITVYQAYANPTTVKGSKSNSSERQIQPTPAPVEGTTVKGSKSNSDNRQVQQIPAPIEGTTVKSIKSNTSERQIQPTPEPAEGTINTTRSNTFRQVQPTPNPAGKVKGSKSNSSE